MLALVLVSASAPGAPLGSRSTTILGVAWNADDTPIKHANLRLRNVASGKLTAATIANETGHFTFENIEGGTYLVELVNDSGRVRAVSDIFTIAPGETVATFVRLGSKVPWVTAFFGNSASSVTAAAATLGIAAIAPLAYCQSPPCH
jgi:hypothetical protein